MIVTEVRLYREGLGQLLAGVNEIDVVAVIAPSDAALRRAAEQKPQVVLADAPAVRTAVGEGSLAHLLPDSRIVVFALAEESEDEVFACAEAGAAGFVGRDAQTDELVTVIRAAARGEVMCSPKVAALFLRRIAGHPTARGTRHDAPLTRREREVLRLIDDDLSNKEIAGRLGIEVATVKNHVHNILEKCNLHRRAEAAAYHRGSARI